MCLIANAAAVSPRRSARVRSFHFQARCGCPRKEWSPAAARRGMNHLKITRTKK
jgi:hypothetical protein